MEEDKVYMDELLGKWIEGIKINKDKTRLLVLCSMEFFLFEVSSDCCGSAEFESIIYPPKKYPGPYARKDTYHITAIKALEDTSWEKEEDHLHGTVYGVELTTSNGHLMIEWRSIAGAMDYGANIKCILSGDREFSETKEMLENYTEFKEKA